MSSWLNRTVVTLRIDEKLIRWAKLYAKRTGKSVSQMVADYFALLQPRMEEDGSDCTPTVKSLKGVLKDSGVGREDYKRYLEEKYL